MGNFRKARSVTATIHVNITTTRARSGHFSPKYNLIVVFCFPAVDDHFAKALGDTWIKLQKEEYQKKKKDATTSSSSGGSGSNATMATTAAAADGGRQKVNVYRA